MISTAVCAMLVFGHERIEAHSQRKLLVNLQDNDAPLVYLFERPYSGQFYSAGRAQVARDPADIARWIATDKPATLLVPEREFRALSLATDPRWIEVARHGRYVMLKKRQNTAASTTELSEPPRKPHAPRHSRWAGW